jgi:signal transduction histidine kinase
MNQTPYEADPFSDQTFEDCSLARALAARMRESRDDLTRRWLDRISARVSLEENRIFPTDALLDHMPLLIDGIADYIENPHKVVLAEVPVVAKAMELGELRFEQGFDEYELLKEYEIFGGILFSFLSRTVDSIDEPCSRGELLACGHRLFLAVAMIEQATVTHYLSLVKERLREREQRLRGFNRALSHELKNMIGAVGGAAEVLELENLPRAKQQELTSVIRRNTSEMKATLDNLLELSRLEQDSRQSRHIALPEAAAEVVRQLRDAAAARSVEVRLSPSLPRVEVSAAAVELCLSNLISNAIKYSDQSKPKRWVEVVGYQSAADDERPAETVVKVTDNGIGVPEALRPQLFERFFRADDSAKTGIEGTGLGLSIVRDTAASLGGRAWAEFTESGSTFAFSMPARRAESDRKPAASEPAHRTAEAGAR